MKFYSLIRQKGSAVFMALGVIAFATALSLTWFFKMRTSTEMTEVILNQSHAECFAEGALLWAEDKLIQDKVSDNGIELPKSSLPNKEGDIQALLKPISNGLESVPGINYQLLIYVTYRKREYIFKKMLTLVLSNGGKSIEVSNFY